MPSIGGLPLNDPPLREGLRRDRRGRRLFLFANRRHCPPPRFLVRVKRDSFSICRRGMRRRKDDVGSHPGPVRMSFGPHPLAPTRETVSTVRIDRDRRILHVCIVWTFRWILILEAEGVDRTACRSNGLSRLSLRSNEKFVCEWWMKATARTVQPYTLRASRTCHGRMVHERAVKRLDFLHAAMAGSSLYSVVHGIEWVVQRPCVAESNHRSDLYRRTFLSSPS